jgi:hypothetical protein
LNKISAIVVILVCAVLAQPAVTIAGSLSDPCGQVLLEKIPPRASIALTGSEFARRIEGLSGLDREQAIEAQLLSGNVPPFLRSVNPIYFDGQLPDGRTVHVAACVLPDYLAIGSNRDFLVIPMRLATALKVANRYGFTLPTSKMVDAIYEQAPLHLYPQPLPASDQMRSTDYYCHHNELIAEQRSELGVAPGVLTSGHMKDLVITNRLWQFPERVAIYGWHRGPHDPIQPLSTVHGGRYVDYSQGVRLVSSVLCVDGRQMSIFDALTDPDLARILNNEGPITRVRDLLGKLASLKLDYGRAFVGTDGMPSFDFTANKPQ